MKRKLAIVLFCILMLGGAYMEVCAEDVPQLPDTLTGVDLDGNVYELDSEAGVVETSTVMSRAASYQIVNFNTKGSALTYYNEVGTGTSGYVCGTYGADAAYLGVSGTKVRFMLSGVIGEVESSEVQLLSKDSVSSVSHYIVVDGRLIHKVTTNLNYQLYGSVLDQGPAPSYLKTNRIYYSYDGHYFYTEDNFDIMLSDYANGTRNNSVNKNNPYYNYFQYLPLRSQTWYSASELDTIIANKASSSSKMYNLGKTFISNQDTYGVNALIMTGVAANESAWGKSNIAMNKNNLFGLNAVDSSPNESANYYADVTICVKDFAETYMSKGYLNPKDWRYFGGFLGNKASGINVKYASDPYWGEKAANMAWWICKTYGNKDVNKYTIGIKDLLSNNHTALNVRKEATTTSTILFGTGKQSSHAFLILGESGGFYKVQSDPVLTSGRTAIDSGTGKYNFETMYAYASTTYITKVIEGTGKAQEITKVSVADSVVDVGNGKSVKLYYNVGVNGTGTIEVYNAEGKVVKHIYDNVYHAAGYYLATWNGTDDQGALVDAGSYTIRLTFGDAQKEIEVQIVTSKLELTNVHLGSTEVNAGDTVKIYYKISEAASGDIVVYNEKGEEVRVIYDNVPHAAGYYLATWNGKDTSGKLVSDGNYDIKIKFGNCEESLRVTIKSQNVLMNISLAQSTVNIGKNEIVRLYYSVEQAGKGSIEVFNAERTKVKTIYDNVNHGVMRYLATWNGTDDAGSKVSAGEYTIRLQFGNDIQEVKVVIQREEITLSSLKVVPEEADRVVSKEIRIYYDISKACKGTIGIYDGNGQLIKEIYNQVSHEKGYYYAFWNLKDKTGTIVSPGKYTAKLKFELNGETAEAELDITIVGNEESVNLTNVKMKSDTVNLEKGEKAEFYYALDKEASGNIYVLDQAGNMVKVIYENFVHAPGYYLAYWNGTDANGKKVAGGTYTIKLVFTKGTSKAEAEVEVRIQDGFELSNARVDEDSFNINVDGNAKIYYSINKDSYGSIGIYDENGKRVKEIYNKAYHSAGYYLATWNKKDDNGKQVPVGEYTVRITFERSGCATKEESVKVNVSDELALVNVKFSVEEAKLTDGTLKIYYKVTRDCVGDIEIYNESGKKVYTLYDDVKHTAGYYSAFWTFVDDSGKKVPSGTYTFKLKFTDGQVVKEQKAEIRVK